MSTDDVGVRQTMTPAEDFADIDYYRVLILDETRGRTYIKQSGADEYHWYAVNRHGAFCGQWFWDSVKTKNAIKGRERSEHCHDTDHEQLSDLKSRIRQGLGVNQRKTETNNEY